MTRDLVLIWHVHQPFFVPDDEVLEQVQRSYEPLLAVHEASPSRPLALNVCGGLLRRLARLAPGWVARLRAAVEAGHVEPLGSGMFHPMLPMLPVPRARAQILADADTKEELLGVRPRGFWPTDLGWSHHLVPLVAEAGVAWVAVDSSAKVQAAALPAWEERHVMGHRVLAPEIAPLVGPSELGEIHALQFGEATVAALLRHHALSWDLIEQQRGAIRDAAAREAWLDAVEAHFDAGADLLVLGDDGERVDPQTLLGYQATLEGLEARGVRFVRGEDAVAGRAPRPIYLPASTAQVDFAPWETCADDRVCLRRLEAVQARLIAAERRHGREAVAPLSDRLLELEDAALTFWKFLRRTREPFLVGLAELDAALDALPA